MEGGGHRLHTELEKSLTEDDTGTDQGDEASDGGGNDRQDQRRRHLALWHRTLRRCDTTDTRYIVTGQDFIVGAETEDVVGFFISPAAVHLTVATVQLHLDLTLAMTLHGCQRLQENLSHWMHE